MGNSSLSAREIGFSKKLFFNLWTLMFEWGVGMQELEEGFVGDKSKKIV